jgi:hypothetical protein
MVSAIAIAPEDDFSHCTLGIVQYQQGKFCAEADTINPTCFQQLVQYKISAGNTFIVSGSAVGRVESVQETAGMEGPFCTNNVTSPLVAARIPMNTQECDQAIHLFDDPDTGGRGPSGQLIDTAIRDTKPAPHVPCFITETAAKVANALAEHPKVSRLIYPGRADHPQAALVKKQMRAGSTLVGFEVKGGKAGAFRCLNALKLSRISNNLGDAKSLVTHPATTTHQRLTPEARAELGISEGFIRYSAGLEHVDDLIEDFAQALEKV